MTLGPERWLDDAPCAFLVTTLDGHITWANRTLAGWVGDADSALGGRAVHELLTPGGRIHFESITPSLTLNSRLGDVRLEVRREDGTTLHLLCSATARSVDGADGEIEVLWAGIDVTDRRIYERELLIVERRLRRLQRLSAAFAAATTVQAVADALLDLLVDGVKADDGAVCLVGDGGAVQLVAERPAGDGQHRLPDVRDDEHVRQALADKHPVFAVAASAESSPPATSWHVVALPLRGDAGLLGVIRLGLQRSTPHTSDERHLLTAAAEMCAQAIERVQLLARLRVDAERNGDMSTLLHRMEEATTLGDRAQLVVDFLVPAYVDYSTIEIMASGRAPVGLRHRDPSLEPTLRWLRSNVEISEREEHSLARGRAIREPRALNDIDVSMYEQYGLDEEQLAALRMLAPTAYLGLPLISRGKVIGSLLLVHSTSGRRFTADDVGFFLRLADACALALENAHLYEHERNAAQQLQTALLPTRLPRDPRLGLRSFYEAGQELDQVGGDWFDAFVLGDDRIGFAVGDVVGGGITAATTMAQLRTALQAYALEGGGVASCLARLNRFAATVPGAVASSVVYAELDLSTNLLTYGCAGHPPPVLVEPGVSPTSLWEGRSSVLGVNCAPSKEAEVRLSPGSHLVLYTDGLVERRGQSLDDGIGALVETITQHPAVVRRPERLAKLLGTHDHGDDTCVLVVTVRSS